MDREIAEKAAEYRSTVRTPDGKWLALADSIVLATSIAEKADILYTLHTDFAKVKHVKVKAPEMKMSEWVKRYGTPRQKNTTLLK